MKKLRNHSQLKQQENLPKAVNNETDLCSLIDTEFKREIVKNTEGIKGKYIVIKSGYKQ